MKKLIILSLLLSISFSSSLRADDDYKDNSYAHAEALEPVIGTFVAEGKAMLNKLYADEELGKPCLLDLEKHVDVGELKYAPLREKAAIITGGVRAVSEWLYGETAEEKARKKHLAQIVTMMWGLFGDSVDKQEGFTRGSYKVIDPDHKLYNFLYSYVSRVTGADKPELLPYAGTPTNLAYRRAPRLKGSSHYKAETQNDEQFGIDMRRSISETTLKVLPTDKTHLLFARIAVPGSDLPLTFIKFEEVGMGGTGEFLDHASHFGASHSNVKTTDRREKDISDTIKNAFLAACKSLKDDTDKTNYEQIAKGPIYKMWAYMMQAYDAVGTGGAAPLNAAIKIKGFTNALNAEGYDTCYAEIRNGNEVILDYRQKAVAKDNGDSNDNDDH